MMPSLRQMDSKNCDGGVLGVVMITFWQSMPDCIDFLLNMYNTESNFKVLEMILHDFIKEKTDARD